MSMRGARRRSASLIGSGTTTTASPFAFGPIGAVIASSRDPGQRQDQASPSRSVEADRRDLHAIGIVPHVATLFWEGDGHVPPVRVLSGEEPDPDVVHPARKHAADPGRDPNWRTTQI